MRVGVGMRRERSHRSKYFVLSILCGTISYPHVRFNDKLFAQLNLSSTNIKTHLNHSLQLSPDNVPTDNLDPLALSIMQEIGSPVKTVSEAREDPLVNKYITDGMNRANEESVSRAARVQVSWVM